MHFTLCTSLYALHSMHFTLCTSLYALHSMHFTLCTSLYALHSMHFTLCNSMHLTLCTSLYALQSMLLGQRAPHGRTLRDAFGKNRIVLCFIAFRCLTCLRTVSRKINKSMYLYIYICRDRYVVRAWHPSFKAFKAMRPQKAPSPGA